MRQGDHKKNCPVCGEPVQARWRICPACETVLGKGVCPNCRRPVSGNWKRCPECETLLVCPNCGRRLPDGHSECPDCREAEPATSLAGNIFVEPSTAMTFIAVPGGVFSMGDTFDEGAESEKPVHEVYLDSYHIMKYPVTQTQWKGVMKNNKSRFTGDDLPVEQVTWDEAAEFAERLSREHDGKYTFRLPSEAEWEFAARSGGLRERFAGSDAAGQVAWFDENSSASSHPVGLKSSNGLGIHDMSGNVWEWCLDTFQFGSYQRHVRKNPVCRDDGRDRVIRGGSWNVDAWSTRCARRFSLAHDLYGPALGFRLVMIPASSKQMRA